MAKGDFLFNQTNSSDKIYEDSSELRFLKYVMIKKQVRCFLNAMQCITPAPFTVRAKACFTIVLTVNHCYIKIFFIIKGKV